MAQTPLTDTTSITFFINKNKCNLMVKTLKLYATGTGFTIEF